MRDFYTATRRKPYRLGTHGIKRSRGREGERGRRGNRRWDLGSRLRLPSMGT